MDLNDLRNGPTPQENDVEREAQALVDVSEEAAKNPPEASPAKAAAAPVPPAPQAPTPETMQFPNPADYGWQAAPQTPPPAVYYRQPVYPYPQQSVPPQGYPQQNVYRAAPQAVRPAPQVDPRYYAPYGNAANPAPGYGYTPNYVNRGPVVPPQNTVPPKQKEKMRGGTKAVFAIILALIVVSLGFFVGYVVRDAATKNSGPDLPNIPGWDLPIPGIPEESRPEEGLPEPSEPSEPAENEPEVSKPEPDYVVIPNTDGIKLNPLPGGEDRPAKDIYVEIKNSLVGVIVEEGTDNESQGSGIIATEDGYIITNAHVVLNRRSVDVKILTNDETRYEGVVVGFDKTTDLAVLKIVGTSDTFTPAAFGDSDSLSVGDWVLAIGNPGGTDFASSLTRGIVSAVNRKVGKNSSSGMTYIQTDAAINPGNSGGALVNMAGQVVGINSSKIVAAEYEGMGFAIPITKAKAIVDDLMANGYVVGRARLGIRGRNVTAYAATLNGIPQGFEIAEFPEGSPFLSVDAKVGDIITAIDGETVTSLNDITNVLALHSPGDTIEITLYRYQNLAEPQTITVKITLLEDKGETQE